MNLYISNRVATMSGKFMPAAVALLVACTSAWAQETVPAPKTPPGKSAPVKPGPPGSKASPTVEKKSAAPSKPTKLFESAADKRRELADLYAKLAAAADEPEAAKLTRSIEQKWAERSSDTSTALMERAATAITEKNYRQAGELLDAVIALSPDDADAFNRRAYLRYLQNDIEGSVGDLRRALALDPNHFKALDGLAQILRETNNKRFALQIYRKLMSVDPFWPGAKTIIEELALEVEGVGL